ncbi:MAG: hypothetical protein LBR65_06540 [Culturomica sp.]|jgi:hypothetical protein|nr:hypothetical protein [Culturomica sp.]
MKKIVYTLLMPALLISAFSCRSDWEEAGGADPSAEDTEVLLSLKLPEELTSAATRALDFASENTIDNVYVLVFNQANNLTDIKPGMNLLPSSGPDPNYNPGNTYSGNYRFTVTLPPATGSNTVRLVVLANSAAILGATIGTNNSSSAIGQSYDAVIARIFDNISSQMYPGTATGRMPMWGETAQINVAPGNNSRLIELIRAAARIDVGVGQMSWNSTGKTYAWNGNNASGTPIPFRLTSVTIVHPNNRYAVIPAAANHTGRTITAPTIPAGTAPFSLTDSKTNFTFNTTTGYISYTMYTPEADIRMGASGTPGDTNHTRRMAIVVGGNYNNSATTTYYRLDFANNGNLINVLRNNLYQFSIMSATGPGFTSVDDAYSSASMNMTAQVTDWNQSSMKTVVFDGTHTLAVTRDSIKLYSNEYTAISPIRDNEEIVYTDVPAGWTVDRIVDANNQPVTWARVSPTTGPANTRTSMRVSVDQNSTGNARSAQLWFAAGGLRYMAVIYQSNQPAIDLRIRRTVNGALQNVSQLIFYTPAGSAPGTAPAPQTFTVDWLPATNPVTVTANQTSQYEFPNPGSNPPVDDGAPSNGEILSSNGSTSYTVAPPAFKDEELAATPFIKKESRFDFTVGNGFSTLTRSITLTQINPTLLIEPNPWLAPYFPMGGSYQYNVRSNMNWQISAWATVFSRTGAVLMTNTRATDNVYVGATGTPNYTPGGGYREQLTTNNQARGNWGYGDITYSSTDNPRAFSPVTRRLFFPAAPFVIYGICGMNNSTASVYNIFSGTTGSTSNTPTAGNDMHTMTITAANYGTNVSPMPITATSTPSSTVFVPTIQMRGYNNSSTTSITTQQINDAVAAGADMLVISGGTTFDRSVADAINTNFLQRNKPVLIYTEYPDNIVQLFLSLRDGTRTLASGDNMNWSDGALNGNAPVYQFLNTNDPILNGPFYTSGTTGLQNSYWGCDGGGSLAFWFTNQSSIIPYSNSNNQSGSNTGFPSGYDPNTGYTCFRFNAVPLIFAGDGGHLGAYDFSSTTSSPSRPAGNTHYPGYAGGYGGGNTKRDCYNSVFTANVIAWAIMRRTTQ